MTYVNDGHDVTSIAGTMVLALHHYQHQLKQEMKCHSHFLHHDTRIMASLEEWLKQMKLSVDNSLYKFVVMA